MRWNGFARSLGFAAVAGAGFLPFAALVADLRGVGPALALYATLAVAVYAAGLGASLRRGLAAALLAAGLATAGLLLATTVREQWLLVGVALAVCRSGVLYRARPARALVAEVALVGAGLWLARAWFDGSALSGALAVWGFFLVQSLFFLAGGVGERPEAAEGDPFDRARERALALLNR